MAATKENRALVVEALKTNLGISKLDDAVIDRLADGYESELAKYRDAALKKAVNLNSLTEALKSQVPAPAAKPAQAPAGKSGVPAGAPR